MSKNINRGLMGMDNGGIDWEWGEDRAGENNGEKDGTTITEQQ